MIPLALMAGAATAGINANSQRNRDKKSMSNQMGLMREQYQNQKNLNQQGADLQFQQWEKTNYPAQMEMMKKAGLNPGLMYGMGGAGGATAGSQGGGAAMGGQAPQPQQLDIASQMKNALELALGKAQKENIEADTENKKAGAAGTGATTIGQQIKNEIDQYGKEGEKRVRENIEAEALGKQNAVQRREDEMNSETWKTKNDGQHGLWENKGKAELQKQELENAKTTGIIDLNEAVKRGQVSKNEVEAYRAELAKAKIDPDSNPIVRELMKAMAGAGVPLSEILEKIVKWML